MKTIQSKDNTRLKAVRALVRSKKEREQQRCFVVEGTRALAALVDGTALPQYRLKEVWVSGKAPPEIAADYCIPHEFMEQLSDCRTSQGVLGVVEYTPRPLAIHPEQGRYLLLDRLMDPGNMGTLIRSAVAFGFDGVLLHGDCVEVFNPKTVRATMGALPFCSFQSLEDAGRDGHPVFQGLESHGMAARHIEGAGAVRFQALEKYGYELIATELRGGANLYEMEFGPKIVLVIGNEANGVSDEILRKASRRLSIPMSGNVESLNAAVAGSICMSAISAA